MPITPAPAPAARPGLALLTGEGAGRMLALRAALWCGWLFAAGYLAFDHVVWRDEVRAFTLALSGDSIAEMLWTMHGEGHPALWYLLLRAGHSVFGQAALPLVAFAVAGAATALIAWRAPFRPAVIALILFSAYAMVDYAVVARNYGLSMLLMAAIAALYPRWRDRGVTIGLLLFMLCNANAPSVLLAGGVLLFWAIELWGEQGWRWSPAAQNWLLNASVTGLGVATCIATVYPPYNDAASLAAGSTTAIPLSLLSAGLAQTNVGAALFLALLVGSVAGLTRAPAALAAAVAVLGGVGLFFQFVYPGFYRHQALALIFMLTMYWLVANGRGGAWPAGRRWAARLATGERFGVAGFVGLLALQTVTGVALFGITLHGEPFGRARDLGHLLQRPALRHAVVIGNPDVVLEPLSYYATNPVWFVREHRWGRVVAFTKAAMRDVSLGEMLATGRQLRVRTHRPVIIVLHDEPDMRSPKRYDQGYLGGFTTTPAEVRAFGSATRLLARFGPPAQTDETYTVYLLTRP